jgi:tetratricopeptide (TPR) repeat protein
MHADLNISSYTARSRLFLTAIIAVGVAVVVAIVLILTGHGPRQNSTHARLTSAISEETTKLNVKPHTIELTSEKATRVRLAIKDGDYSTAQKITAEIVANSHLENWRYYPFSDFIGGIADLTDQTLEAHLNAWIAQDKDDAIPLLIRAQYYYQMGWLKRGSHSVQETSAASFSSFESYMKKALIDAETAIHLNDGNPYGRYLKLLILRGFGMSQDMKAAFDEAIAKYPVYFPLYEVVLRVLEPKWGGTTKAMYAFVDQYAGHAAEYSPLKLLYLSLYRELLSSASTACVSYWPDRDKMAQCVAPIMQRNITPELEKHVVAALQLYDHADKYQFGAAIEPMLFDILKTAGGDRYAGAILELAASSMHSNTQLSEEQPGHNNYIIDKAVSQSWYSKGFYDNALKKGQEALKDVENTAFPSEEEKDWAVSDIYQFIAGTYNKQNQYTEMIAYEEAAVRLGRTAYEYLICYGYYRLKDYDGALPACTRAIEDGTGNMQARYWRGAVYRDLGKMDAALRDFTVVADSQDNLRTSAAIDMSMVHFNRNDVQSALNVLNKYTYLYDLKTDTKADIAVSYNNRCYAYMQLGELTKALDDCTASLRYGSLPDAYRKQMELTKRLRDNEKGL